MKRNFWSYRKVKRYQEKKTAWENLIYNLKILLGINYNTTVEELDEQYNRQKVRLYLSFLIQKLIIGANAYDEKQILKESELAEKIFKQYDIHIYNVTEKDIDILFKILKKI